MAKNQLYYGDNLNVLRESVKDESVDLVYLDPPYYEKGQDLYPNFYAPNDHVEIAARLSVFEQPWMMTYDDSPLIREVYADASISRFPVRYSLQHKRLEGEIRITPH